VCQQGRTGEQAVFSFLPCCWKVEVVIFVIFVPVYAHAKFLLGPFSSAMNGQGRLAGTKVTLLNNVESVRLSLPTQLLSLYLFVRLVHAPTGRSCYLCISLCLRRCYLCIFLCALSMRTGNCMKRCKKCSACAECHQILPIASSCMCRCCKELTESMCIVIMIIKGRQLPILKHMNSSSCNAAKVIRHSCFLSAISAHSIFYYLGPENLLKIIILVITPCLSHLTKPTKFTILCGCKHTHTRTHTYTHACAAVHACLHEVIGNILLKG